MPRYKEEQRHILSNIDSESKKALCNQCGAVKIYGKAGVRWRCSNLTKQWAKRSHPAYYKKNRRKLIAQKLTYIEANKERIQRSDKARRVWKYYRLTLDELDAIDSFQRNHPIYGKLILNATLGTDHDHKTGLVRGRLDWRINRAYGLLERVCPDNLPEMLRALAEYHEHPPAELALGKKTFGLIGQAKYKKKMVYGSPEKGISPKQ